MPPQFGTVSGHLNRWDYSVAAKPIEADRLFCRGRPDLNPASVLDPAALDWLERPFAYASPPDPLMRPPPVVRVLASRDQRIALYHKLAETGRLKPVRVPSERRPYASGLFWVLKDLSRDRLILDSRPANVLEHPQGFWTSTLAGPSCLLQIVLQPSEVLRIPARTFGITSMSLRLSLKDWSGALFLGV